MIEWILSSSVLIAVVIALRYVLRGKLSLRLQYALWALVLVRLLVPVSFAGSNISVMNAAQTLPAVQYAESVKDVENIWQEADGGAVQGWQSYTIMPDVPVTVTQSATDAEFAGMKAALLLRKIFVPVWLCGALIFIAVFASSNIRFASRIRRTRKPLEVEGCGIPVYIADAADTPCLFGLLRPAIYVTPEAAADAAVLWHTVEHEKTHFIHRDNIWSLLRGACLALHWYNPLVWWAAVLSQRDAELACDEATIARIGESERAEYGRTLIGMTCRKRPTLLISATEMTGSAASIKERITLIAKKPKMKAYTLVAVLLIAVLTAGCTFTGAKADGADTGETDGEWASADVERWQDEVELVGYSLSTDSTDYAEIGSEWADKFVAQYVNGASDDSPLKSSDAVVLSTEFFAQSLTSSPKTVIYNMRFACDADNTADFEKWYVGWAGPLDSGKYPQYNGWMEFGWFVVLQQSGDGWTCAEAGSGGYGGWGYINYDWTDEFDMDMEELLAGGCDDSTLECILCVLPLVDWGEFERKYVTPETDGWSVLWTALDSCCLTEGRAYDDTRMWSDVYPDDQAYRDMYVMLGALNSDGAYSEGLADILKKQRDYAPEIFDDCLAQLTAEQQGVINMLVKT